MQWLRRSFITGFFVTVPLIISVAALVWMFRFVDGVDRRRCRRGCWAARCRDRRADHGPLVSAWAPCATNVFGKRVLQQAEGWLLRVPVFKTIYAPVRQLVAAFSPDNEAGFKQVVVVVEDPGRGMILGFLTREFTLDRGAGREALVAVYVPTNHLYLGDIVAFPARRVHYPDLTVEDGIRIFLTGGMALPTELRSRADAGRV